MKIKIYTIITFVIAALSLFLPYVKTLSNKGRSTYTQHSGFNLMHPIVGVVTVLAISLLIIYASKKWIAIINIFLASMLILWGLLGIPLTLFDFLFQKVTLTIGAPIYALTILSIFILAITDFRIKRKNLINKNDTVLDDF